MSDSATLALTRRLIAKASVTPDDQGCQAILMERLQHLGFKVERLRFDDVDNFWALRGDSGPLLTFAGHTDVVPAGDLEHWHSPPFEPTVKDGYLYGRGAADMKGSLAAMITACEQFIADHPKHPGRIAFLITSDEEGPALNGTQKVVQWLEQRQQKIDWCIVGEPSSTQHMGDVIKNGRRGSLGCELRVKGVQGHVAYPHLAENPIHRAAPALAELARERWDEGNQYFPATSFQISNFNSGTGATNVIPGEARVVFNFRFSTEVSQRQLIERSEAILQRHDLNYEANWQLSGEPFLTDRGELIEAGVAAIKECVGIDTQLSTAGGTSDGRFIAPTGAQVVELGPVNATIHQVDECVKISDLDKLSEVYCQILVNLFIKPA